MDNDNCQLNKNYFHTKGKKTDKSFTCKCKVYKNEIITILKMAFPVLITNVLQYLITLETMSFCGRLSSVEVEAVGLSLSLISALGWCICNGMVTACDTLFSQAYGSDARKRTGIFLQRGLMMMNLVPIFLACIHINLEPILIMLGQNPNVSRVSGEFLVIFTPGLAFMMNYLIFARYMQTQNLLWPPVIAAICGNVFNVLSQLFFISYLGFGFRTAALCHALSFGVMVLYEIVYIFKTKLYLATWPGFQYEAFYDWWNMFKLGLAGTGQVALEVFIWEGNIFMGGLLGTTQLATQSILLQVINIIFSMYMAVGISGNIRVGQCLGANKPNQAKTAYRAGLVVIGTCIMAMCLLIISLRNQIPCIFTNEQDVISMVIDTFPSMYLLLFVDPISAICAGALRGCGRQALGGLIIFVSFYLLSLPSSIVLAFVFRLGIKGLWIGTTVGSISSSTFILLILECQNWKRQAALAHERVRYKGESLLKNLTNLSIDPQNKTVVHRMMILKRILTILCTLTLFLIALSIHLFLSTELYRPFNSSGNTTSNN